MTDRPRLILASSSPRRLELLARIGVVPDLVLAPEVDEAPYPGEVPRRYVERIARAKTAAIATDHSGAVVLAGDTTVAVGRRILGKPADEADHRSMLELLAGRRHHCLSAVCVVDAGGTRRERLSDTVIAFRPLPPATIAAYVAGDEGRGKAGGYAIQGRAEAWVRHMAGSHSGVVGLPLGETRALLLAAGIAVD